MLRESFPGKEMLTLGRMTVAPCLIELARSGSKSSCELVSPATRRSRRHPNTHPACAAGVCPVCLLASVGAICKEIKSLQSRVLPSGSVATTPHLLGISHSGSPCLWTEFPGEGNADSRRSDTSCSVSCRARTLRLKVLV